MCITNLSFLFLNTILVLNTDSIYIVFGCLLELINDPLHCIVNYQSLTMMGSLELLCLSVVCLCTIYGLLLHGVWQYYHDG